MDIFISWSGKRSHALAIALREWVPRVIQSLKPWISDYELNKGIRWSDEIGKALSKYSIGLICVTPENQNSPWLLFEAGALSKQMEYAKICPILLGMKASDLKGPLNQFQSTIVTKTDMLNLCKSLNIYLGESKLSDSILQEQFDEKWAKFEELLNSYLSEVNIQIDSEDLPSILDALIKKGLPEPVLGRTANFESGFESHLLYEAVLNIAQKRIYIFGRKNRKLFDKEHGEFFQNLKKKIEQGFEFKCLFLDPNSPQYILSLAHQDSDFPIQLDSCIKNAVKICKQSNVEPNKVCRTYKIHRQFSIVIVDNAVLYTPIETYCDGRAIKLTKCPFSIIGAELPNGKRLINIFNSAWDGGEPVSC